MAHDLLRIDFEAASVLAYALADAGEGLRRDRPHVVDLLDRASRLTGRGRPGPVAQLARAQHHIDDLTRDLWGRMRQLFALRDGIAEVDELTARIADAGAWYRQVERTQLMAEREARLHTLLDGDAGLVDAVLIEIARGTSAAVAIDNVHRSLIEAEIRQQRVDAIREELGLTEVEARALIERVDQRLAHLVMQGASVDDATIVVGMVEAFDLDLDEVIARARRQQVSFPTAAGEILTARGIGLTMTEFDALQAADQFVDVYDTAGGGRRDHRFSKANLTYVVEHPWEFTAGQMEGARALLASRRLFNRIDTANENDGIFEGTSFGSVEPGDGVIADVDVKAFMVKNQVHAILQDYADEIDVANDAGGVPDGFHSQGDLRAFLADNPDLPEHVRGAADLALNAGWFDEGWWQDHKDEIAAGMALLAAGSLAFFTTGTSLVVLGLVGLTAAGGTTVAINLATDDPWTDDLVANAFSGFLIGVSVGGIANGARTFAAGGAGQVGTVAGIVASGADVVVQGGADIVIPSSLEDEVGAVATAVGAVAVPIDMAANAQIVADGVAARAADEVLDEAAELAIRQAEETLAVYATRETLPIDAVAAGETWSPVDSVLD